MADESTIRAESPRRPPVDRAQRLVLLGLLALAALVLFPGLGATGLWSEGELPILDRSLAALGEPRSDLVRSPWLPDALRTWAFSLWSTDAGLRLPGALAGVGLVALTGLCARAMGWSARWVAVSGCAALALPLLLVGARTVLGAATGELWMSAGVLAALAAVDRSPAAATRKPGVRLGLGLLALACLLASTASLGIVLGGALPLLLIALADLPRAGSSQAFELPRAAVIAAWTGAAVCGFAGLWLITKQGEGYIPLLGAAKDLGLAEDPTRRPFSATLEEYGYQVFPLTGLIAAGLLSPGRGRWAALWLGAALILTSAWSQVYGPTPAPVVVPSALLATAAVERILDPDEPIAARRLLLACALLGALILGKDAGRTPEQVASPLLVLNPLEFPGAWLELDVRLPSLAKRFAALLLLAHLVAPPSQDQLRWRESRDTPWWLRRWQGIEAALDRLLTSPRNASGLDRARRGLPLAMVVVALLAHANAYGRVLLRELGEQLSLAAPLQRWLEGIHDGSIPHPELGLYRIDDPGLTRYGPGPKREVFLSTHTDLDRWHFDDRPRTTLIRRRDLPATFSKSRKQDEPFHVLDDSSHRYALIANFLPPGREDQNPFLDIALTPEQAPSLANETLVAWEPYVELIAWEIDGPVHRGSHFTLHMLFRVERPLPAGAQLYARLQKGKVSRVGAVPHELTDGVLPPKFWRAGDIIHNRLELEVPWLEIMPGEHDLIVGLRRTEKANIQISTPAEDVGEHGVELKGSKHEFAIIGQVEVAW
ncbi:hypothetical protein G6O69_22995 [Pseudenhygromyxa sp. WMMC2535]|uniref:hypothetical protein n=1 Tax=Pseudenhygromyxa sp. WMMC2535 TaxID=2712867 RepID=UPI001556992C|nr:hypothetical protein [Pseudenhygromyxa sp. WMMC2535]NVB40725.1 hypothetical protein [Pseudenhygromyxa sp. WMMC2535]